MMKSQKVKSVARACSDFKLGDSVEHLSFHWLLELSDGYFIKSVGSAYSNIDRSNKTLIENLILEQPYFMGKSKITYQGVMDFVAW